MSVQNLNKNTSLRGIDKAGGLFKVYNLIDMTVQTMTIPSVTYFTDLSGQKTFLHS